jgi:hypothetical protein
VRGQRISLYRLIAERPEDAEARGEKEMQDYKVGDKIVAGPGKEYGDAPDEARRVFGWYDDVQADGARVGRKFQYPCPGGGRYECSEGTEGCEPEQAASCCRAKAMVEQACPQLKGESSPKREGSEMEMKASLCVEAEQPLCPLLMRACSKAASPEEQRLCASAQKLCGR